MALNLNTSNYPLSTRQVRTAKLTAPASYPAGGIAVSAAEFNLTTIHQVHGVLTDGTHSIDVYWDFANGKLRMFQGSEDLNSLGSAAGTLSNYSGEILVIGD